MKNISSILNVVLLIAVAILFYLHFSTPKQVVPEVSKVAEIETDVIKLEDSLTQFMELDSNIMARPIKIAYVNNDSLTVNLKMLRDVEDRIEAKSKILNSKIQSKQNSLNAEYERKVAKYKKLENDYVLTAPSSTEAQLKVKQEEIGKLQQELQGFEMTAQQKLLKLDNTLKQQFGEMRSKEMSNYYVKLQSFCQSFAKTLGFDYIMVYQEGGAFLYSNPDYDVSNYVIDAINKEYSQNNKSTTSTKK